MPSVTTSANARVLRPHHLRDTNEVAVLRHLIERGPTPRLEIAHAIGLTQGSVTRIVARLLARHLVQELPSREQDLSRGRPKVPLHVIADAYWTIGAHIGVQHLTLGITGIDGVPVESVRFDHDGRWDIVQAQIVDYVEQVRERAVSPLLGVGVILGGRVDPSNGELLSSVALGWERVPIARDLEDRTDLPVYADSSARAHAHADLAFGAAGAARSFLHVFVGNLVEVAQVVDGVVQHGRDGGAGDISGWPFPRAGEPAVSVKAALSDTAVLQQAQNQGLIGAADGLDALVSLARQDSAEASAAQRVLLERASSVGVILAQLDALLAPDLIVLSSGVLALEGTLEAASAALTAARAPVAPPPLRPTRYGSNPLVTAAAAVVLERTLLAPLASRIEQEQWPSPTVKEDGQRAATNA